MATNDWDTIKKALRSIGDIEKHSLDTQWLICYNDGTRKLVLDHNHDNLEEILQAFEDFCKGAGFIFDGFAIVDEDGIPVNGLNSIAKLEAGDEDQTG
jgi:hypothetical protein